MNISNASSFYLLTVRFYCSRLPVLGLQKSIVEILYDYLTKIMQVMRCAGVCIYVWTVLHLQQGQMGNLLANVS